jgi:TRAP-type mannitol/chloroaromatic compound transport system substrate-binding protein
MSMNRREFLKTVAASGAAIGLVGCATQATATQAPAATATTGAAPTQGQAPTAAPAASPTAAQVAQSNLPDLEWQMATSWPLAQDTIFGGAQVFAERVGALTNGKFKIDPRPAGELAPGLQVLDVVSQGAVPIGHTASYYYVGKSPVTAFGTALPFGFNYQQQNAWLYEGGGLKLLQNFYTKTFNVIQFPAGNTGVQMGGWFRKEINTPADLQGLKMRIPGLGGQVLTKLGVTVQVIAGGEIFQALSTGAVDAAEWVGPYDDEKLQLNKAAEFYYYPGWWEPGPTLEVEINLNEWNNLPVEYQEAIKSAAFEANTIMLARYDARNGDALQRLVEGGTKLRGYSNEILEAAEKAAFELYDEFAASNADFKAIFEQWKAFRDRILAWHNINEGGMARYLTANLPR